MSASAVLGFVQDGSSASRIADTSLYSRSALAATQMAFREHCRVRIEPAGPGKLRVVLTATTGHQGQLRSLVLAFWNYALDKAAQEKLD